MAAVALNAAAAAVLLELFVTLGFGFADVVAGGLAAAVDGFDGAAVAGFAGGFGGCAVVALAGFAGVIVDAFNDAR
ncbi:hypothetical protein D3C75_1313850 [compost metagenome]